MPAKKAPLRAVALDEKPKPSKPQTIEAAVAATERELLVAMRDKVAVEIDGGVPAHALAGLLKHLRELDKEIRGIDARSREEDEEVDDDHGAEDEAFDPASVI